MDSIFFFYKEATMSSELFLYFYEGPVCEFGRCVQNVWRGQTLAVSEKKAKSNLAFQWKYQNNRLANTKVELPGEIRIIGG